MDDQIYAIGSEWFVCEHFPLILLKHSFSLILIYHQFFLFTLKVKNAFCYLLLFHFVNQLFFVVVLAIGDCVIWFRERSNLMPRMDADFGNGNLYGRSTLDSLSLVCPSVCPSLSFLKIGSLHFLILYTMIADHDI